MGAWDEILAMYSSQMLKQLSSQAIGDAEPLRVRHADRGIALGQVILESTMHTEQAGGNILGLS